MVGDARRSPLRPLTGLRFIAAILVVTGHYLFYFAQVARQTPLSGLAGLNILVHDTVGVDFFFVLSGFILAYNYFDPSGGLRGTRGDFWIARIARIYPIYLFALALALAQFLGHSHTTRSLFTSGVTHPLLLQAWLPVPSVLDWTGWNPPSWSLSVEALFYLLFPLLLVAMGRFSPRMLSTTVVCSWLIYVVVPAALIVLDTRLFGATSGWWFAQLLYYNPVLRLPEFVLGMGLGLLFMKRGTISTGPLAPHMGVPILVSLVSIPVLLLVLAASYPFPSEYPIGAIVDPLLAVFIFSLAYGRGPLAYLLSSAPLVLLGEASYALYVLHWPLWYWTARINGSLLHLPASSPQLGVAYFFLVITLSILCFLFIERPTRAAIKARYARAVASRRGEALRVAQT